MGANTGETSFHSADHMECHRRTLGHLISSVLATLIATTVPLHIQPPHFVGRKAIGHPRDAG